MEVMKNDPDMLENYDFSNGIRGKYTYRYKEGTNIVMLDPELVEYFPDSTSVNDALKSLVKLMKKCKNTKAERTRIDCVSKASHNLSGC